ncbi:MAG: hypothetical protein CMJ51_00040 [Planctomycetaceae bacterium]|nr:hypothetical protein [Planctomycetaceae bacterium]
MKPVPVKPSGSGGNADSEFGDEEIDGDTWEPRSGGMGVEARPCSLSHPGSPTHEFRPSEPFSPGRTPPVHWSRSGCSSSSDWPGRD